MNEEDSVLGLLFKQMEEEKMALTLVMIQGSLHDFAEYKLLSGKIHGLAVAQSLINGMAERLRKQNE